MPQIGGLIGAVGGAVLVVLAVPVFSDQLAQIDPGIRPFAVLAGLLIVVALGESIGSTVGRRTPSRSGPAS